MYLLTGLAISVLSGVICHFIARKHGANAVFWGVMGVLFGPFAIPFAFLVKGGDNN